MPGERATSVTVYFATNRMPEEDAAGTITGFGSEPGPVDGISVRFGSAVVTVSGRTGGPVLEREATIEAGSLAVAPEKLTGATPIRGSRTIFDKLRLDMTAGQGCPTIVIVHGFANSFTSAIERAATICDFYFPDGGMNVFSFTWPSRDSGLPIPLPFEDYAHDRGTSRSSGTAMARTLHILYDYIDGLRIDETCRQPLHLICHSMGNYAFRHCIQALMRVPVGEPHDFSAATDDPPAAGAPRREAREFPAMFALPTESADPNRLRRTFDQIILAAADEDEDAFDSTAELKFLPRLCAGVTVYHTRHDWVLSGLSRITKFNGPRLGTDGPDNMGTISDKVTAVDVSDVVNPLEDLQSHQYYRVFRAVRDDAVAVLQGARPAEVPGRAPLAPQRWRIDPAAARPAVVARPAAPRAKRRKA